MDRLLLSPMRGSALRSAALIAATLAASWSATYIAGGAGKIAPHFFYVPILLSGLRFGVGGALLAASLSTALAGPLMPSLVAEGTRQALSDWLSRGIFFFSIGTLLAYVYRRSIGVLQREAEVAQRERELAAQQAALVRNVTHEFRTPLTVISLAARTLERHQLTGPSARRVVDGLMRGVARLDKLVSTVLAAAEAAAPGAAQRPVLIDVAELVGGILEVYDDADRVRVTLEIPEEARDVRSSAKLLVLVLDSLISNALRFSPKTAPVVVSTARESAVLEIRVRDWGDGIEERYRSRAFTPFTQQDDSDSRSVEGLGIGLSVARTAAAHLGSELELTTREEGGTDAIIRLQMQGAA